MKTITLRNFAIALAIAFSACVSAQAQQAENVELARFGYFSYEEVLKAMPQYQAAQQQISQLEQTYEAELQRSKQEFSRQYAEFAEGQQTFTENILLKRQKELEQLMQSNLQFKAQAQAELQSKKESLLQPVKAKLNDAIHQIGMNRHYAFILNTDQNAVPFVNAALGDDITADILKILQ